MRRSPRRRRPRPESVCNDRRRTPIAANPRFWAPSRSIRLHIHPLSRKHHIMATTSSNDPAAYPVGTTPTGSEELLVNQAGALVSLTTSQITQLAYSSVALWKTYDTVAQMKAGAGPLYPRVKWRGYNYVGDGGGGEGLYTVPASGVTYTADEGAIFATAAGGYVIRDIPAGDVQSTWFGMTSVSGPANTSLNPTTSAAGPNPSTDFSTALQNASNFAAAAGRALHIVGRSGSYRLASPVTFTGVRRIYGDGATLDARFGTTLNWQPATTTDMAAGVVLPDEGQIFEKIQVITTDANWPVSVTSATLVSGGQLTVPSGFVWHTDVLPYSAFKAGLAGIAVNNKCILRDVTTLYGKFGAVCNTSTGHITFDSCSLQGGCAGRFWLQNGQDHFIIAGGADGKFCSELLSENNFAGSVYRYHQYHSPVGWYQCNYFNTGSYSGMYLDGHQLSVEALSESWIMNAPTAISSCINTIAGGAYYGIPVGTSAYELSNRLPDELFANSLRNYYSLGRLGGLGYFRLGSFPVGTVPVTGAAGTFAASISGFPGTINGSDFSCFNRSTLDLSKITGNTPYNESVAFERNVPVLADRSDVAIKTQSPALGNLVVGTNAYSATMGLGVNGNCLVANGGGYSLYNGTSSSPGSVKMDTYRNWLAAGVQLVIPEAISRMVGNNPLIVEVTNVGTNSAPVNTSIYIPITANNVADGQQGLYCSVYVAGMCGPILRSSAQVEYSAPNFGTLGSLTFAPVSWGGKVLAQGVTITQFGVDCNSPGKVYVMCPMANFGALAEFNPHPFPAQLQPVKQVQGLMQPIRKFVTSPSATTTLVTIADYALKVDTTAAPGTATLPAMPYDGEVHVVKRADASANALTIVGNGKTIDGSSTLVLSATTRPSVKLQYFAADGDWSVV
ncbi:hypothetical protein OVY01_21520 [Robbsia sp. Bb-Pol-6]|uniref:Pectate lyase superfamily protein domain-containing protein n=1 Tax=Robbsia betulipollinis TaxID=2981849 RepID=A0ABT3ZT44_9BURK|nr:hypothetical protein [Robbsia betulipollinis]MCY0389726.1 hypothetical protein [Robbsia betulipollinis]